MIDRSDAVNLALDIKERDSVPTPTGIRELMDAVLAMDEYIRSHEALQSMPAEVHDMLDALRSYEQADPEGVSVKVSRQAVDEAVELIASRYAPLQR